MKGLPMELKGKVCLVTGGTSGIGAATARYFAENGMHVVVTGRMDRGDALKALQRDVESHGVKFLFVKSEAADSTQCYQCVRQATEAFGSPTVLVHAAGGPVPGNLLETTPEAWENAFAVHVHSAFHLCRAVVPGMQQRKEGAIVLISSVAGLRGTLGALAYGVVKGTLPQMTRLLARELADVNVRVNCVAPGVIRTPFQDYLTPAQVENNIRNRIPLHREGTSEQVAAVIGMLAANDFMTGENIVIDGGMTMRIV